MQPMNVGLLFVRDILRHAKTKGVIFNKSSEILFLGISLFFFQLGDLASMHFIEYLQQFPDRTFDLAFDLLGDRTISIFIVENFNERTDVSIYSIFFFLEAPDRMAVRT